MDIIIFYISINYLLTKFSLFSVIDFILFKIVFCLDFFFSHILVAV